MNEPAPVPVTYLPLGIFEVRRELEPHADNRRFDICIDVELTRAASLGQFQHGLRKWLRTALVAKLVLLGALACRLVRVGLGFVTALTWVRPPHEDLISTKRGTSLKGPR